MVGSESPARSDTVADRFGLEPGVVLAVHCSLRSTTVDPFLTDNKSGASEGASTTKILEVERQWGHYNVHWVAQERSMYRDDFSVLQRVEMLSWLR